MDDFLTRLAARALGLVPAVQPILAPMYAPEQQFVGAEDSQEMPLFERGPATEYPQPEVREREMSLQDRPLDEPSFGDLIGQTVHAQEMSLQDRSPDEPSFGDLIGQTVHAQETLSLLVPQWNKPSPIPIQTPRIPGRTLDEQPVADHPLSLGRDEAAPSAGQASITESTRNASATGLHPIHPTDGASIPIEPRTASIAAEQERDSGLQPGDAMVVLESKGTANLSARATQVGVLPLPLVPQGNRPVEATMLPPIVDVLSVQRPAEPKVVRPQQDTSQMGHPVHLYNQGNQYEVAPFTQESSAPAQAIQVTIGRIEVRAMPPANPRSQPRRSELPVMSLEEYLNQRAKGGY
jgi:hypothetical protein